MLEHRKNMKDKKQWGVINFWDCKEWSLRRILEYPYPHLRKCHKPNHLLVATLIPLTYLIDTYILGHEPKQTHVLVIWDVFSIDVSFSFNRLVNWFEYMKSKQKEHWQV